MSDLTWEYPAFFVVSVALGGYLFYWLTKVGRAPAPKEFERVCGRCKLKTVGESAKSFLYCPFCAAKYETT